MIKLLFSICWSSSQSGASVRVNEQIIILENRFSVPIHSGGHRGEMKGEIDRDGVLVAAVELMTTPRWKSMIISFSTPYRDGIFRASGPVTPIGVSGGVGDYTFVLSRVSPSAN